MFLRGLFLSLICLITPWASAAGATSARIEVISDEVSQPWSMDFLPDGSVLVTQLSGELRIIRNGQVLPQPVEGVPPVYFAGQGGLMEVLVHPKFASNQFIYLMLSHGSPEENRTRIVRGRFDGKQLMDIQVIFDAKPSKDNPLHYGGKMIWGPDEKLYASIGDSFEYREEAQSLKSHLGTIIRLNEDGSVPSDNPFVGRADALPEIWTYGHRNSQGLAFDSRDGSLYEHEHGPKGGDEVNLLVAGSNYGWPLATYGINYSGAMISPYTDYPGTAQPLLQWTPSIAPSGFLQYTGALFPEWQGDFFIGALAGRHLAHLKIENGKVIEEPRLLTELGERIRDVKQGPGGAIWLLTDGANGRVLRLVPE